MRFLTIDDLRVKNRRVLLRADFNVPLIEGDVADDFRIHQGLPTVELLRQKEAQVVVASHLGRPRGSDPDLSLAPVASRLASLGGFDVRLLPGVVGAEVLADIRRAEPDTVLMLENTRYEPGESRNDTALAQSLSHLADLFVLDAFGAAHRAHASTAGVAGFLQSAAGPLIQAEVTAFERLMIDPPRPFVVVLGGAKVSDKLGVIKALLPQVDRVLVGGGMCFTLIAANGGSVGESLVDQALMVDVADVLGSPSGHKIELPSDVVAADGFAAEAQSRIVPAADVPEGWTGLDVGPETAARYAQMVMEAAAVFWNGPMGVFEWERFRAGTEALAQALKGHPGYTVVGGGDSVAALRLLGLENSVSFVSTGGGAGLALLQGRSLPALEALERWAR